MKIGERIDLNIPDNQCFGCGENNPDGLRLEFVCTGVDSVETRFFAREHHCGAPNVIHGGIQATLLDEVMGVSIRTRLGAGESPTLVTAEFNLRYRRPALAGQTVVAEGRLLRAEGRNRFVEGRILNEAGEVLTTGEARWVSL